MRPLGNGELNEEKEFHKVAVLEVPLDGDPLEAALNLEDLLEDLKRRKINLIFCNYILKI